MALASLESLLLQWLPGGRREGHEYKALNPLRADSRVGSFSVNLNTGAWADFATGDKGGDAISLYAYLNNASQLEAAQALAAELRVSDDGAAAPGPTSSAKRRSEWVPLLPVPADAPVPPKAHLKRGRPSATWTYRRGDGAVLGVIYRFQTSDGGKEILPCVFAEHPGTKAREWRWMAFPQPRPLYRLDALAAQPAAPVLVVEGEKCADAAAELLGESVAVCTWPGGSKAVDKADWAPLAGRAVVIWPDCDAQAERDGALLPEAAQPGMKAAQRVAVLLRALAPPARVKVLAIPAPGTKPSGWDVADAIAEGMTREALLEYLRTQQREPAAAGVAEGISTQLGATAEEAESDEWRRALIWSGRGLKDCRENVIYILRDHPAWRGVLGADTFAKTLVVRRPSPLGQAVGAEWTQDDDVRLGLWFAAQREQLLVRSPDTLRQAVQHVARLASFHPVREFLDALAWDGRARVDSWTARLLGAPDAPYPRLVGRFFLINMVRRIYDPGCIMRSVPVLEGPQDKGKSTFLRILASPWFSDTPFKVGDKDAYQQIQGVLLYEISELESFTRAEATAVKAFVSSTEDNFRAPYERQNEKHPRQTVFAATTNAVEYLKDWTGNTRFWPLPCGEAIDLDGIAAERDQLMAEAVALYRDRAPTYPTHEQQARLFKPEQDRRMMPHPWQDMIADELEHGLDFRARETVSIREVLHDIVKVDLAKINPQGSEAQRVGQIMHALGWRKQRASGQSRAWVWARPVAETTEENDADDSIPF